MANYRKVCGCERLEEVNRVGGTPVYLWVCLTCSGLFRSTVSRLKHSGGNKLCDCPRGINISKDPLYNIWAQMKNRCNNPNNDAYPCYGGRGVSVCTRWNEDFIAFKTDMGARPSRAYSLERVDNDKGYDPENCVWALRRQQSENKRERFVGYNGVWEEEGAWRATPTIKGHAMDLGVYATPHEARGIIKYVENFPGWDKKAGSWGSSRYKGVTWVAAKQRWRAYVSVEGKQKYLGLYKNEDAAAAAVARFKRNRHLDFNLFPK